MMDDREEGSFNLATVYIVIAMIVAAKGVLHLFGADLGPAGTSASGLTRILVDAVTSPVTNTIIIMVTIGSMVLYMSGIGSFSIGERTAEMPASRPIRTPTLPMSATARAAEQRLRGLAARFRAMPADMVEQGASIEFEGIETRHLPNLEAAHRHARKTVSPASAEAAELDGEYAMSLDRLSATLERLIEGCEALGRERLAIQSRFIEVRHPDA